MTRRRKRNNMAAKSRAAAALILFSTLDAPTIAQLTSLPHSRVATICKLLRGEGGP